MLAARSAVHRCLALTLLLGAVAGCSADGPETADDSSVLESFAPGAMGPWALEGDEMGSSSVVDEALVLEVSSPDTMQYSALRQPTFQDFIAVVEATLLDGESNSTFGMLVRMQGPSEFYRFELTGDGRYMIERRNEDGSWTRYLDEWQSSPAIVPGPNGLNTLRVEARGSRLKFSVNGETLKTIEDSLYSAGRIALDAGTFGQGRTRVAFDNLHVTPE
jgi:hypothetical protein